MKKIVFITAPDAEYGFRLAGISQHVTRAEGIERALKEEINEQNGLIIVDERLIKDMPGEKVREIERVWHGILLVLPAPERPGVIVEDYIARLIRRAIGYHVRLQP